MVKKLYCFNPPEKLIYPKWNDPECKELVKDSKSTKTFDNLKKAHEAHGYSLYTLSLIDMFFLYYVWWKTRIISINSYRRERRKLNHNSKILMV